MFGNVARSHVLLVHEQSKCLISCLLELHVIFKSVSDHVVNISLELEKLLREIIRIFKSFIIINDSLTAALDVWLHRVNDVVEGARVAFENLEK